MENLNRTFQLLIAIAMITILTTAAGRQIQRKPLVPVTQTVMREQPNPMKLIAMPAPLSQKPSGLIEHGSYDCHGWMYERWNRNRRIGLLTSATAGFGAAKLLELLTWLII